VSKQRQILASNDVDDAVLPVHLLSYAVISDFLLPPNVQLLICARAPQL